MGQYCKDEYESEDSFGYLILYNTICMMLENLSPMPFWLTKCRDAKVHKMVRGGKCTDYHKIEAPYFIHSRYVVWCIMSAVVCCMCITPRIPQMLGCWESATLSDLWTSWRTESYHYGINWMTLSPASVSWILCTAPVKIHWMREGRCIWNFLVTFFLQLHNFTVRP